MNIPKWIPLSVIALMGMFVVQVVWLQQSKVQRLCEQPAAEQVTAMNVNNYHTTSARDKATTTSVSDCNCSAHDMTPTDLSLVASSTQSHGGIDVETSSMKVKRSLTHYLLVVVVLSTVHGKDRRDAIRQTWMRGHQDIKPRVMVKFVIGTLSLPPSDLEALMAEEHTHHDLLFLSSLNESYQNLTRKVLYTFQWADEHLKYSYLLKCDDDSYVHLDTMTQELARRTSKHSLYWGYFTGRQNPKSSGKWAENKWFLCDHYLPYAMGGGYVISSDLIHRVAVNADGIQLYNSEDVSVGVWLSSFDAERKHDVRFDTEATSRGCRNDHLISHKQPINEMLAKFNSLKTKGLQCSNEYTIRKPYSYNWRALPSKCCIKH